MSKAVLISIQPKWCEALANGKKTVEVRKTKPKLEVPFKVYIYCTKGNLALLRDDGDAEEKYKFDVWDFAEFHQSCGKKTLLGGKVIGEFVCDRIQEYESEFVDNDCLEYIASIDRDEDDVTGFYEWKNDELIAYRKTNFFKECCIEYEDLKKYLGIGFTTFYGWHISDLIIYDEPKELSEFVKFEKCPYAGAVDCSKCTEHHCLTRPPQSWCYVEEMRVDR